uniref:CHK domain-containing protein n=1 Tax=Caenorhabditis japonica TaxID=281687 RepID=A0A8R1IH34_CAEJA
MLKTAKLADGLLGTTLQWEDVEEIANDGIGGGELKIGEKRTIRPLAEGVGLQSLLGIVEVDWQLKGRDQIPYPKKFALKIGSAVALLQVLEAQATKVPADKAPEISDSFIRFLPPCHNSEIYFYNYIQSLPNQISELPEYYFGREIEMYKDGNYSKGCIALELIEGVRTFSPIENFSENQMLQVLNALAKLQVQFLGISEEKRNKAPHEGLAGLYFHFKDWFLALNNELMAQFPDPEMQKLSAEFKSVLPDMISASDLDKVTVKLGMEKVLVHGDLWSANIMWKDDKLAKLIDFQMIHFGLAGTDLARLFNTCLSPEDRRKNTDTYLKYYYDSLVNYCKEDNNGKVPFTYENLQATYNLAYPRVSAYLLPALTAISEKVLTMPDVPEKPFIVQAFMGKVKGIYEDIIQYHLNPPNLKYI